jgi:hypothetical protein
VNVNLHTPLPINLSTAGKPLPTGTRCPAEARDSAATIHYCGCTSAGERVDGMQQLIGCQ